MKTAEQAFLERSEKGEVQSDPRRCICVSFMEIDGYGATRDTVLSPLEVPSLFMKVFVIVHGIQVVCLHEMPMNCDFIVAIKH